MPRNNKVRVKAVIKVFILKGYGYERVPLGLFAKGVSGQIQESPEYNRAVRPLIQDNFLNEFINGTFNLESG